MAILIESPTGNILVDERSGNVLDEQALRSMARQTALLKGLDPDAFEAQIDVTTQFDPLKLSVGAGVDPGGYFTTVAEQWSAPPMSPGDPNGNVISPKNPQMPGEDNGGCLLYTSDAADE